MANEVQDDNVAGDMQQRQAMLAMGLLTAVFCFGSYFGRTACWLMILVALILLSNYPVLGVPVWLWAVLAGWLVCR